MRRSCWFLMALALLAGSVRAEETSLFKAASAVASRNDDASWDQLMQIVQSLKGRIEKAAGEVPYTGIVDLDSIRKLSRATGKEQNLTEVRLGGRAVRTGYINNSAVVVDGDLNDLGGYINHSVVVVKGNVSLTGYINNSIVFVDGSVSAMGYAQDSLIVSSGAGGLSFVGHVTRSIVVGDLTLVGQVKDAVLFGTLTGIGVQQNGLVKKDAAPVYEWIREAQKAAPKEEPPKPDVGKGAEGDKGEAPSLFRAVHQIAGGEKGASWKELLDDVADLSAGILDAAGARPMGSVLDPKPLLELPEADKASGGLSDSRYASSEAPQGRLKGCAVIVDGDFKAKGEYIKDCLIVVNGDMEFDGYIKDSLVIVRGKLTVTQYARDVMLVTGAGSENRFEYVKDSIIVGDVTQAGYVKDSVLFGTSGAGVEQKGVATPDGKGLDLKSVRSKGPAK